MCRTAHRALERSFDLREIGSGAISRRLRQIRRQAYGSVVLVTGLPTLAGAAEGRVLAAADTGLWLGLMSGSLLLTATVLVLLVAMRRARTARESVKAEAGTDAWEALEQSPVAQLLCADPEQTILWANAAARSLYGERVRVGAALSSLHEEDLSGALIAAASAAQGETREAADAGPSVVRASHRGAGAHLVRVELQVRPVRFGGRAALLLVILRVDELHALRVRTSQLERRLRDLSWGTPVGLWELNLESGCISGGAEIEAQLGLSPGEFPTTFDDLLDWVAEDHRQALSVAIERAVGGRGIAEVECELSSRNRHVRIEAFPRVAGVDVPQLRGRIIEISEMKRMEQSLRQSEARFRGVADGLPDAVLLVAADGTVAYANDAALRLWEVEQPSALLGRPVDRLVEPQPLDSDDPDQADEAFRRHACSGLDGRRFVAAVSQTVLPLPSVDARLVVLRARELGERVAEKLQLANRRLRQLSNHMVTLQERERRKLARDLHDEVGQALTATLMHIDLLARRGDEPVSRDRIHRLRDIVEASVQQVRGMLQELRPPQLDELGLAAALRAQLQRFDQEASLDIELDCLEITPRPDPRIESTAFRLVQECLTNVIKHAAASRVTVRVWTNQDRNLRLEVIDDGKGFDVGLARAGTGEGGRGLGLLSMLERVHLVGGELDIQSVRGLGTQFSATLPLQPQQEFEHE